MRILELTDLYPPFVGGLERHVKMLANSLTQRGHDVAVATAMLPGQPAVATEDGVEVHRITGLHQTVLDRFYEAEGRPFHATAPDPVVSAYVRRLVARFRPDVVHAHSWSLYSYLPVASRAVPLVATAHDYGWICAKKTMIDECDRICAGPSLAHCLRCAKAGYGTVKGGALAGGTFAFRSLLRRVDCFSAVSGYVATVIAPTIRRVTGKDVHVLYSFVPDDLHGTGWAQAPPAWLPRRPFVLFVGALSSHKGLGVLLDAHTRMVSPPPLLLLGIPHATTPDPGRLPPGVTMRVNVPHADVIAAMVRSAVVAVPSLWPDPLPMTVSEAELCGVPVVASETGGIPEQIDNGRTGLLVRPGDPHALAVALQSLMDDPARRAVVGAAGRTFAAKFEISAATDRVLALFTEEIDRKRPQAA